MNIVHRDIKPLNIIKTGKKGREFVLIDLGIAFYLSGTNFTRDSNKVPGSAPYLAPEFFKPNFRERMDFRSDLYNVGLTIY
tara:strand:- start:2269 stop:2511 length:243 start_codon:yes stop_codon:yes gene_type:complete